MQKLILVTVLSFLFAALSHSSSEYDHINSKYIHKERFFYGLVCITLILFAGLRTGYNDTGLYRQIYKTTPVDIELTKDIEWLKFGENPGYVFVNRLFKRMDISVELYIMLFSAFTIGANLWFFRKYSCNFFLSVLLFVTFAGYIFNLAAIKQCTAMALCLIATDRAIQKKYGQFLLFVFLACLFHAYSFMYLVIPFLAFRPWGKNTIILLVVFAFLGLSLQSMLGTLLNVTDMLGEGYDASSFTGEGINPIRLLVTSVPIFLSLLTVEQITQREDRAQDIILNATMLNGEIMFIGLFGTANYFGRLANYFIPFQAVALPRLFSHFDSEGKQAISIAASVCYLLFYIYSQSIHELFDNHYSSITFFEFLKSLF